jgi:hypothetical protein
MKGRLINSDDRKTVANDMLSLQGSIQPDPFSEEHSATQSGKNSRKKRAKSP